MAVCLGNEYGLIEERSKNEIQSEDGGGAMMIYVTMRGTKGPHGNCLLLSQPVRVFKIRRMALLSG